MNFGLKRRRKEGRNFDVEERKDSEEEEGRGKKRK
jgi:hypothetical protein